MTQARGCQARVFRALHPTRLARRPRVWSQRPPGRNGIRLGAPRIGRPGATGYGAGPSLRAPATVLVGSA
eukprot:12974912-Alexandrium_andersonii.AAC.1